MPAKCSNDCSDNSKMRSVSSKANSGYAKYWPKCSICGIKVDTESLTCPCCGVRLSRKHCPRIITRI
jgi:hypothetical protein